MSSVYPPIVTGFQPSSAHVYSLTIHNQPIKDIETLRKEGEFAVLSPFYAFSDGHSEAEVIQFIKDHPFLLNTLLEAPRHIFSIFGKNVPLYLELHHDPEESWDELFIVIKTGYSAEKAINLENRLVEEWFLDRIKETKGKLNIMEEPL